MRHAHWAAGVAGVLLCSAAALADFCPGDVNADGATDNADLNILLASFDLCAQAKAFDERADLLADGCIDQSDLNLLLADFGCVGDASFELGLPELPFLIQTDLGAQSTPGSGSIQLIMSPPDAAGERTVQVVGFSFEAGSVDHSEGQTGGLTWLLGPLGGSGFFNEITGQLQLLVDVRAGYWWLEQVAGGVEIGDELAATFETWQCMIAGTLATPTPPQINLTIDLQPVITITNKVQQAGSSAIAELKKKLADLFKCPKERVAKKRKVCIQPVFIAEADGTAPTGRSLAVQRAASDALWARGCIEFEWKTEVIVKKPAFKIIEKADVAAGKTEKLNLLKEVDEKGTDDCIEVFFVSQMNQDDGDAHDSGDGLCYWSGTKLAKIILSDAAVNDCNPDAALVLAHEMGHALGGLAHATGCVMTPSGNPPNCPGANPNEVKLSQLTALTNPLIKDKAPEQPCCLSPNCN